jgi:uncharacterized protein (TIGR02231 family)
MTVQKSLTCVAALCAFSTFAGAALAADVAATSRIDAVTVYPATAEVTRVTKVRVQAGEHAVILSDLPAGADPASIRVEGKATGRLDIGSVDSRRLSVARSDIAQQSAERKRIEDQIEALNDEKAQLQGNIQAAEAQKALVAKLIELPTRPVPASGATQAEPNWTALIALVGERTAVAQKAILETQVKIREVDRRIGDLKKLLRPLPPAQEQRTEVKINVVAGSAVEAELSVRYQIAGASWMPFYDARLTTGTRSEKPKLQLVRRASIQQRTGEKWDDVQLALSTARPQSGTAAPELYMMSVDFQSNPPPPMPRPAAAPAASAPQVRSMARGISDQAAAGLMAEKQAEEKAKSDTVPVQATVDTQSFQALYGIPGRVTIAETGEPKRVQIVTEDLDPQLLVRTVPRFDPTAYLYTKITIPKTASPTLRGQVSLFRDGTFVGNGQMAELSPGEEHELAFGKDERVRVKRVVLEDKKGETGIISTSRVEERNFQISVKNLHSAGVQVQVLDRVPVAAHQEIKVDVQIRNPQPTKRDHNDRRGTLLWDLLLAPDEEKSVAFGYKVTSPVEKPIVYRDLSPEQINLGARTRF